MRSMHTLTRTLMTRSRTVTGQRGHRIQHRRFSRLLLRPQPVLAATIREPPPRGRHREASRLVDSIDARTLHSISPTPLPTEWVDDEPDAMASTGWWHRKSKGEGGGDPVLRYAAPDRLVAIGDVHGDAGAMRRALTIAGAVDSRGNWIGGDLVIVQTGDLLDRGPDELLVLRTFARLKLEARAVGGDVQLLLGNHEMMNVEGNFVDHEYDSTYAIFDDEIDRSAPRWSGESNQSRISRLGALAPGGPLAAGILSECNVATIIGPTLFVHGGLLPEFAGKLHDINYFARQWLRGAPPSDDNKEYFRGRDSPLWCRSFSKPKSGSVCCETLQATLSALGVDRMVVGHTPQTKGITSECGGGVWRIDTGMSAAFVNWTAREVQVLEIVRGSEPRIIAEGGSS
eukprot:m.885 g.885  ORF g.885 m.885 type:complete len:400 (+) comp502_c0_seq1:299-1498(+)